MSDQAEEIVRRARALVGAPFRFQGRDPQLGLDCVGLTASACGFRPSNLKRNYSRRDANLHHIDACMPDGFERVELARIKRGDVLLCAVRQDRLHFAIHCGATFVHADARLGRVVEVPSPPVWPIVAAFRATPTQSS